MSLTRNNPLRHIYLQYLGTYVTFVCSSYITCACRSYVTFVWSSYVTCTWRSYATCTSAVYMPLVLALVTPLMPVVVTPLELERLCGKNCDNPLGRNWEKLGRNWEPSKLIAAYQLQSQKQTRVSLQTESNVMVLTISIFSLGNIKKCISFVIVKM